MSIAIFLHEWREAEGLTLMELAEKTGLSASFLSDIERGRTEPSIKTLRKIAGAYNLHLDIRFVRDGETVLPPGTILVTRDLMAALKDTLYEITSNERLMADAEEI